MPQPMQQGGEIDSEIDSRAAASRWPNPDCPALVAHTPHPSRTPTNNPVAALLSSPSPFHSQAAPAKNSAHSNLRPQVRYSNIQYQKGRNRETGPEKDREGERERARVEVQKEGRPMWGPKREGKTACRSITEAMRQATTHREREREKRERERERERKRERARRLQKEGGAHMGSKREVNEAFRSVPSQ